MKRLLKSAMKQSISSFGKIKGNVGISTHSCAGKRGDIPITPETCIFECNGSKSADFKLIHDEAVRSNLIQLNNRQKSHFLPSTIRNNDKHMLALAV
ncbi:MAG: hypothetical protein KAH18_02675 [Psychromonas sp.]|nr:hypothetical protein [Psychromonas sp.]